MKRKTVLTGLIYNAVNGSEVHIGKPGKATLRFDRIENADGVWTVEQYVVDHGFADHRIILDRVTPCVTLFHVDAWI